MGHLFASTMVKLSFPAMAKPGKTETPSGGKHVVEVCPCENGVLLAAVCEL